MPSGRSQDALSRLSSTRDRKARQTAGRGPQERPVSLVLRALQKLKVEVQDPGGDRRAYGHCPFHEDAKPDNWFIRLRGERRGQYHCFSCKANGGLVDLIAHVRKCSVAGAREWLEALRADCGEGAEERPYLAARMEVGPLTSRGFRMPAGFEDGPYVEWPETARRYAEEQRHIPEEQRARWGIGYSLVGRLSGRLVLPVHGQDGVARSYMGRSFVDHAVRYYYPAEREGADKDVIFGERYWPALKPRGCETVVLTEGALNALAVERAIPGVYVAALGGSQPRPMHVLKVAGFGRVVVFTDGDRAGDGAAAELTAQLVRHTEVVRVSLGEDRDADDVPQDELRELVCGPVGRCSRA